MIFQIIFHIQQVSNFLLFFRFLQLFLHLFQISFIQSTKVESHVVGIILFTFLLVSLRRSSF